MVEQEKTVTQQKTILEHMLHGMQFIFVNGVTPPLGLASMLHSLELALPGCVAKTSRY